MGERATRFHYCFLKQIPSPCRIVESNTDRMLDEARHASCLSGGDQCALAEVFYGIEILPAGKRRAGLSKAVENLFTQEFQDRILPFDEDAARTFPKIVAARERAGRPIAQFDAMIASIVRCRRCSLATRNTNDFEDCGIAVVDPWSA